MKKNFLGRGWAWPIGVNEQGGLRLSEHERNIEQSIGLVLGTAPGERVMRPDFGCHIHDFVFHPNNANTAAMVAYHAREAVVKWEPRVRDVEVEAYPDALNDNVLLLDIRYKVIRTNELRNLVYPFYLRREQDL